MHVFLTPAQKFVADWPKAAVIALILTALIVIRLIVIVSSRFEERGVQVSSLAMFLLIKTLLLFYPSKETRKRFN